MNIRTDWNDPHGNAFSKTSIEEVATHKISPLSTLLSKILKGMCILKLRFETVKSFHDIYGNL